MLTSIDPLPAHADAEIIGGLAEHPAGDELFEHRPLQAHGIDAAGVEVLPHLRRHPAAFPFSRGCQLTLGDAFTVDAGYLRLAGGEQVESAEAEDGQHEYDDPHEHLESQALGLITQLLQHREILEAELVSHSPKAPSVWVVTMSAHERSWTPRTMVI